MQAITASYQEHDDDWSVTVTGMGRELTEHAPGIIAARDQAEQLVDSLKPEQGETAVVHLLRGSALEFTTAYMTARLTRTGNSDSEAEAGLVIPEQAGGDGTGDARTVDGGHDGAATSDRSAADGTAEDASAAENARHAEGSADSAQELAK